MTLYFPQLSSGTLSQMPLVRDFALRTVVNTLPDGSRITLADPDAAVRVWQLRYQGLTDLERDQFASFFAQAEGRLRSFVFPDPCGNLLRWSEDVTDEVWTSDPLLQASSVEGAITLTNAAQTNQSLSQTVETPGWFRYCFALEARSANTATVRLALRNSEGSVESAFGLSDAWSEVFCSGSIPGSSEELTVALTVDAGAAIAVRHMRLQAQPAPSAYRRTGTLNGIFRNARFDADSIEFQADGVDSHSVFLRVLSPTRF